MLEVTQPQQEVEISPPVALAPKTDTSANKNAALILPIQQLEAGNVSDPAQPNIFC